MSREELYLDAVFGQHPEPISSELDLEVTWVRATFVERLGWDRAKLARFPFRALAEAARPGRASYVRLKGVADYAATTEPVFLEAILREAGKLPHRERRTYLEETLMPLTREVGEELSSVKMLISKADLEWIKELAVAHGHHIGSRDDRVNNQDLGRAIVELLKAVYDR